MNTQEISLDNLYVDLLATKWGALKYPRIYLPKKYTHT